MKTYTYTSEAELEAAMRVFRILYRGCAHAFEDCTNLQAPDDDG